MTKGLSPAKLAPFIANMHVALWVLSAVSLLGMFVCMLRPAHVQSTSAEDDLLSEQAAARLHQLKELQPTPGAAREPASVPASAR